MQCAVMANSVQLLKRRTCSLMLELQRVASTSWTRRVNRGGCSQQGEHSFHLDKQPRNITHSLQFQTCSRNNLFSSGFPTRKMHFLSSHHLVTSRAAFGSRPPKIHHFHLHGDRKTCILQHPARRKASRQSSPVASNPLLKLQPFVSHPILDDKELIFTPSDADIARASELFVPRTNHQIEYIKGAYYPDEAPKYNLSEVAFIGRSNVGKSSLIKSFFSEVAGLKVRTSKTPGQTKLLLFFQVGRSFSLVDMPGYGFNQPANFVTSAEGFLKNRKNLRNTFLLIDSCVGLQEWDYVAINMLEEFAISYLVVLTKSDKASKRQLIENILAVSKVIRVNTQGCLPQPFLVSSKSGEGLPFLKAFIAYTTGNLVLEEL